MRKIAIRKLIATAVCMMTILGVTACVSEDSDSTENSSNGTSTRLTQDKGEKYASSMQEYIDQTIADVNSDSELKQKDPSGEAMKRQLEILERTKQEGSMSEADYESIWSGYKQCMIDRGYKEIILIKQSNGLYKEAGHMRGDGAHEKKYAKDMMDCGILNKGRISSIYEAQRGNPNLYKNIYEGALDCMKREKLVSNSYSLQDLEKDLYGDAKSEADLKADIYGPKISACLVANNIFVASKEDPLEQLW